MEEKLEEQSTVQFKNVKKDRLEITYENAIIIRCKVIFWILTILVVTLFISGFYSMVKYTGDGDSYSLWFSLYCYFFEGSIIWFIYRKYYLGVKRWKIEIEGNNISYQPRHNKIQKFMISDISVVDITCNLLIIRNLYGKILLQEKVLKMPGGVEILCVLKEHNIPIRFLPGAERVKECLKEALDLTDDRQSYQQNYPWNT